MQHNITDMLPSRKFQISRHVPSLCCLTGIAILPTPGVYDDRLHADVKLDKYIQKLSRINSAAYPLHAACEFHDTQVAAWHLNRNPDSIDIKTSELVGLGLWFLILDLLEEGGTQVTTPHRL